MSLLERTKSLLRDYRSLPKKSFGQNFVIEPSIYQLMVNYASLNPSDTVLDVGAGFGFLTQLLAEKCKIVLAVEADKVLASVLRKQFSGQPNVKVIEGNILKLDIPDFDKIVSTPPYNISSRLILWMFSHHFSRTVLVLQKEFARRLVAAVGSESYGWLTVLSHYYAEVELLEDVPRCYFYPQPDVDSLITLFIPKKQELLKPDFKPAFKRFVQVLFTQRNRKVKNAVLSYLKTARTLPEADHIKIVEKLPYSERRVRELAPEDFGVLANAICN